MLRTTLQSIFLSAVILATGPACPPLAHGEASISGAESDMTIEVHDTPVQEVLAALGTRFGLRVRGTTSLDRRIDGRYEGALRGVVARLLNGYDYVIKTDERAIEVIILGLTKRDQTPPQNQAVPLPTKRRSD